MTLRSRIPATLFALAAAALVAVASSPGCARSRPGALAGGGGGSKQTEALETMNTTRTNGDEARFESVQVNIDAKTDCSPVNPDPNWLGIEIRAPAVVRFPKEQFAPGRILRGVIPVCGYYNREALSLKDAAPMRLVAEDPAAKQRFAGEIHSLDPSPIEPPPETPHPPSDEALRDVLVGSYFNPNLLDFVALPARPAAYEVYVEHAGARSNRVTIRIAERGQ